MSKKSKPPQTIEIKPRQIHLKMLNSMQLKALEKFEEKDVLFLLGAAGTGKSLLATFFAIREVLAGRKQKIIITRPIVEAGENLGYLPGSFEEKVHPYMLPIYDSLQKLIPELNSYNYILKNNLEVAPIAYLRGRTFSNSICILDEAQNCTVEQLILFLTRFDTSSKVIVTGDPMQSDLRNSGLMEIVNNLSEIDGIGSVFFDESCVVRHPLVAEILLAIQKYKDKGKY